MSGIWFFNIHRSWEDWVSMLIGVLIGFSPWLADQQHDQSVMWNAVLVGALVLALAQLEYVSLQRWEEIGEIALGLWLMASPFIFGYAEAGALRYWHFVLGGNRRAACRPGALAGLDTERQGACQARPIANDDTYLIAPRGLNCSSLKDNHRLRVEEYFYVRL